MHEEFRPYLKGDTIKEAEENGHDPQQSNPVSEKAVTYTPPKDCGKGEQICSIENVANWNTIQSPKSFRCPSYRHDHETWPAANYAGSIGPQCVIGPCLHNLYIEYCNQPEYGVPKDPNFKSSYGDWKRTSTIRGCFNRTGAKITFNDIRRI